MVRGGRDLRARADAETREDAISESDAHWARHQEQPLELQAYGYIVADFERDMALVTSLNADEWLEEFDEVSLER